MPEIAINACLVLGFLLAGCQMHDSGVTVQSLITDEGPTSESWNPEMFIWENGLPRLRMRAGYMARFETADSIYQVLSALDESGDRVRVDIFDANGDSSAVVFADRIIYFERERRFVAEGDVVVQAKEDRWLYAEHLTWSERTSRVRTPGFASIKTPTQTLNGFGLDADEDLKDFSLARVSGKAVVEDE